MALTLRKIASNTATVALSIGEDTLTVVYYPSRLTEKTIADLNALNKMTDEDSIAVGFKAFNDVLVQLIKEWDLYDDEAETVMFPITSERLPELPIFVRKAVIDAIMGDIRPEKMTPQTQNS